MSGKFKTFTGCHGVRGKIHRLFLPTECPEVSRGRCEPCRKEGPLDTQGKDQGGVATYCGGALTENNGRTTQTNAVKESAG